MRVSSLPRCLPLQLTQQDRQEFKVRVMSAASTARRHGRLETSGEVRATSIPTPPGPVQSQALYETEATTPLMQRPLGLLSFCAPRFGSACPPLLGAVRI